MVMTYLAWQKNTLDKRWDPELNGNASFKGHQCANSLKLKNFKKPHLFREVETKNTQVWLCRCISNYKHFICYDGWRLHVPEYRSCIFGEECPGFRTPWPLTGKRNATILYIIAYNHLFHSLYQKSWLVAKNILATSSAVNQVGIFIFPSDRGKQTQMAVSGEAFSFQRVFT